jgi:hypothetical protein
VSTPNPILFDAELLQTYAIIRSTPVWKDVQESMTRLERLHKTAEPYDQMDLDRDNVLRYAAILRNSSDSIACGICVAAHLSRFSTTPAFEQRLNEGFLALSTGLDLPSLTETETRDELQRCGRAAFPNIALNFPALNVVAQLSGTTPPQAVVSDQWRKALEGALSRIATMDPVDVNEVEQKAADSWQARLEAFLAAGSGQSEIPPDIDYLRCRAAKLPLGMVLRGRLKNVSLREWSETYVAGTLKMGAATGVPLWFALGALGALGFDIPRDQSLLRFSGENSKVTEEASATMKFISRIPTISPPKGLLVLRLTAESQTAEWKISPSMPALVLTPEEFLREGKLNVQTYFQPRLTGVLVEVARDEQLDAAQKRVTAIKDRLPSVKVGLLIVTQNEAAKKLLSGAVAVKPSDALDASTQAFSSSLASGSAYSY